MTIEEMLAHPRIRAVSVVTSNCSYWSSLVGIAASRLAAGDTLLLEAMEQAVEFTHEAYKPRQVLTMKGVSE